MLITPSGTGSGVGTGVGVCVGVGVGVEEGDGFGDEDSGVAVHSVESVTEDPGVPLGEFSGCAPPPQAATTLPITTITRATSPNLFIPSYQPKQDESYRLGPQYDYTTPTLTSQ